MQTTNITNFRNSMAKYLDLASAGEPVLLRRGRRVYSIKQVEKKEEEDDRVYMTPELQRRIEEAEKNCREGRCVTLSSHKEIDKFFDSFL